MIPPLSTQVDICSAGDPDFNPGHWVRNISNQFHARTTIMAEIVLYRGKQYYGVFRQLEVLLDGAKVGSVSYNQRKSFPVSNGRHELVVKMDWCVSPLFVFMVKDNAVVEFECGCNFGPLGALLGTSHSSHDFFYIRAISPLEAGEGVWPPAPGEAPPTF